MFSHSEYMYSEYLRVDLLIDVLKDETHQVIWKFNVSSF